MERTGYGTWDKEGVGSRGREEEEMEWENLSECVGEDGTV
jgi:hypothetical protein